MSLLIRAAVCCLAVLDCGCLLAQGVREERGTLPELVEELTGHDYTLRHPAVDRRPYVDPGDALRFARRAAALLAVGEVEQAAITAAEFGYELIDFYDTATRQRYFVLREDLGRIPQLRGWGAYLLNTNPRFNALIEAPHPVCDTETAPLAAKVFESGARGLLIAGAHRKKADVPDFTDSVFHQVHSAWIGGQPLMPVLQVHGFSLRKHDFPADAQLVLSAGAGVVTDELQRLDQRLDQNGFPTYVYNDLDPRSKSNRRVNGDTPGDRFRALAATQNVQGQHSRDEGGTFVHLEFEYRLRHDPERREQAAAVVAATMMELSSVDAFNAPLPPKATVSVARAKAVRVSDGARRRRG